MRRVLALGSTLGVLGVMAALLAACGASGRASSAPAASGPPPAPKPEPVPATGPPKDVDCGDFTTCAVSADHDVRCWGRDKEGEIGDGGGADKASIAVVPALGKVTKVALAAKFGCALLDTKKVKCWGTGRIANDGKSYAKAPPTEVAGLADVEELVASGAIACARSGENVTCWGADPATIGTPAKGKFTQLTAGFTHACAVDKAGAVSCWGSGDWGGKGPFAKAPVGGVAQLVTGDRHACALTKDKKVRCWGSNDAGQLGTKPDIEPHKKPVDVPGMTGVVRLFAGEASTCALLKEGAVKCWGANSEGELGFGSRSPDERPTRAVALADVEGLCLGAAHGCAVTKGSKLVCWGGNAHGQLGDGSKERKLQPASVVW